jgi:hypothetical protein
MKHALVLTSQAASIMNMPRQRIPQWARLKQMRGIMMYFFLSQSAMLFGGYIESQVMRITGMKTYVRIINEVDAPRMAKFPVNFAPNFGYSGGKSRGRALTELNTCNT